MTSSAIGNLSVNLTLSTAAFQKGATLAEKRAAAMEGKFKGLSSSLNGIAGSLKGISAGLAAGAGAAAVAGLAAVASNAFQMGSALTEAAAKVGVTVEALQEMRFVAQQNGVSIETMDGSLNKMTRTLGELQLQNPATTKTFQALGLSAKEFIDLTPTESFTKIVDALSKIKDETVRAALGNKVFGRSYAELKPLVDLGAAGIRKAADEKLKDGVISTEQAAKLDDLADGWDRLKEKVTVATASFIANTSSSKNTSAGIDGIATSITGAIGDIGEFINWLNKVELAYLKLQRLNLSKSLTNPIVQVVPGMKANAQQNINDNNARIQQLESSSSTGRVRGTGRRPSSSGGAGGALAGIMAGAGAGALATLESLERKAAIINETVAAPVTAVTTKITAAFDDLSERVQPLLDRLFPEVRALVDYKAERNDLKSWLDAGKISVDQFNESLVRLRDGYFGTDGPTGILQDDSWIQNISDSLPDLATIANDTSQRIKRSTEEMSEAFAYNTQNILGSISQLAGRIKGGGFFDILQGIAGVLGSLSGAGVFGGGKIAAIASAVGSLFGGGRANGGPVKSGTSYLVGERGPELLTMGGGGGFITPNNKMNAGGGRGVPVQIIPSPYFNVVVDGRADSRVASASPGIASAAAQGVQTNIAQGQFRSLP